MAVAFDASGSSGAGGTCTLVNSAAGNAIVVAGESLGTGSNTITSVTYGAVTIPLLGFLLSGNVGSGGIALYGKIGGLPTGSNTVTVNGGPPEWCGAATYTGAASFGTAVTNFNGSGATSGSAVVTGTTSGGIVVAGTCFGGGSGGGTFSATSPATLRWQQNVNANSGAGNGMMEDQASNGGSVTIAWTNSVATGDIWTEIAVEILPSGGTVIIFSNPPNFAPKWHPGRNLPGAPGGTPFYAPSDQYSFTAQAGVTSNADTSLTVTNTITADASTGAGSSRQWLDQAGSRPRWAALLRNKTRRTRYWTVPETGLNTADTSLTVTAGITADSVRVVSADTSLTVTSTITAAATAGGGSTQEIIYRPAPRPRWSALLRTKQLRKRSWTVPTTGLQTLDASMSVTDTITASATRIVSADTSATVTMGITADAVAGGESTRQIIRQPGSRPKWAALLRTKQRRDRYFRLTFPALGLNGDASLAVTDTITAAAANSAVAGASVTVTAGITAAVTETASANTSLTVTAGITAAVTLIQHADTSLAVTDTITAAATGTFSAAASLTVTAGITAAASVGVAVNPTIVTAGITAAASNVTSDGASTQVTAGITANAVNVMPDGASLAVTAGITANAQAIYRTSASVAVTTGITSAAVMTGIMSAVPVAVSAAVSAAAQIPSIINKTIAIKWNTEVLNAPSSTLLSNHWKSMINDTRGMTKDGTKYTINDVRGMPKDGTKYMTNGGYK